MYNIRYIYKEYLKKEKKTKKFVSSKKFGMFAKQLDVGRNKPITNIKIIISHWLFVIGNLLFFFMELFCKKQIKELMKILNYFLKIKEV